MKTCILIASAALAAVLSSSAAPAWDQDPFAMYIRRSDTITLSAGNAKDVNAATHVIDPWPRQVRNRRIPANGERMVGAMQRYQGKQGPRGQGAFGGGAASAAGGAGAPPPAPPSGAATPSATLPF